jgi:chromosome segregation ATPase
MANEDEYEDERAENAVLIADLKSQLQKAEAASDEYMKQLGVLQARLDDALNEQGKLEDQAHEKDAKIETLQNQVKESARRMKELEQTYDADRAALLREKEQQAAQEEELHFTIQRLKETLAQRDLRLNADSEGKLSRSCEFSL